MSKEEFLYRLETLLMDLPRSDREDVLRYYGDYFEAMGPEMEKEAIRELVSPEKVAETTRATIEHANYWEDTWRYHAAPRRKGRAPLWIVLGVLVGGILLSILAMMAGFFTYQKISTKSIETQSSPGITEPIDGVADQILEGVREEVEDGADGAPDRNALRETQGEP